MNTYSKQSDKNLTIIETMTTTKTIVCETYKTVKIEKEVGAPNCSVDSLVVYCK